MNLSHLKVGDEVFVVLPTHRQREEDEPSFADTATVTKVGRVYFTAMVGRTERQFARETGREKAEYIPGRAYADRAEYGEHRARSKLEREVQRMAANLRYGSMVKSLSVDDLRQLLAIMSRAEPVA